MGESYSVKAVLSAADKNFSSTLKAAAGYADNQIGRASCRERVSA